jgi:RNA polymerase sigma-70 factor (ECF subfamily)
MNKTLNIEQNKQKQDEFLKLFNPLKERLWRFCLSISRNYEDAKELLSETIYQAYINFGTVKSKEAFLSYLFTIASRANAKRNEKQKRIDLVENETFDRIATDSVSLDDKFEIEALYLALDKLPPNQKEAIILFDIMGFSRDEICDIQVATLDAVKARLFRGRNKLAELLGAVKNNKNIPFFERKSK